MQIRALLQVTGGFQAASVLWGRQPLHHFFVFRLFGLTEGSADSKSLFLSSHDTLMSQSKNDDLDTHKVYQGLIHRPQVGQLEKGLAFFEGLLVISGVVLMGVISWQTLIFLVVWFTIAHPLLVWSTKDDPDFLKILFDGIAFERHYHPHSSVYPYSTSQTLFAPSPGSNLTRKNSPLAERLGKLHARFNSNSTAVQEEREGPQRR